MNHTIDKEIVAGLDFPAYDEKIVGKIMPLRGWAFSKNGEDLLIDVYVNGNLVDKGSWGLPRFDVYKKYSTEESYESGFVANVNLGPITNEQEQVVIHARSSSREKLFGQVNIRRFNETSDEKPSFTEPVPSGGPIYHRASKKKFLDNFIKFGNLKQNHKILDVGGGIGRKALSLTNFLSSKGEYVCLDILSQTVEYCKKNITERFPNFHFILADIYNKMYNPRGRYKASEYKFPFDDNTFDFIILTSVFSHLVLSDMENYLSEISRLLKKDGRSYITFYLLNENSKKQMECGLTKRNFKHKFNGYWSTDEKTPEKAIAYEETYVRKFYEKYGLKIIEPIHFGRWCGVKSILSNQDVIIAEK